MSCNFFSTLLLSNTHAQHNWIFLFLHIFNSTFTLWLWMNLNRNVFSTANLWQKAIKFNKIVIETERRCAWGESMSGTAWILKHRVKVIFHAFYLLLFSSLNIFRSKQFLWLYLETHFFLSSFFHSFENWNQFNNEINYKNPFSILVSHKELCLSLCLWKKYCNIISQK